MYPYTNDFRVPDEDAIPTIIPTKCPHLDLIESYCNIVIPSFLERYKGERLNQYVLNRLNEHLEFCKIMAFATKPEHTIEAKWTNVERTTVEIFYNGGSVLTITG